MVWINDVVYFYRQRFCSKGNNKMKTRILSALFGAAAVAMPLSYANAEQIKLQSLDGNVSMQGEIVEFDGKQYILRTSIGEMTIDAAIVRCVGEACPKDKFQFTEFTISGAQTLAKYLLPSLIEGFAIENDLEISRELGQGGARNTILSYPDGTEVARVNFSLGGSSQGMRDLLSGDATLAVTTRPIRNEEASILSAAGLGDLRAPGSENIIALDGLLIVTSPQNPVRAIVQDSIAKVFAGEITNWSELGGRSNPINVYVRGNDSGTGFVFNSLVMNPARLRMKTDNVTVVDSDAELSDLVANDPHGIGFTSFSEERGAKSLAIRGTCGIQTPANAFTIKTEEYPLTRRLYLYMPQNNVDPLVEKFVEYANSAEAQQVVAATGFADQGVSVVPINDQGLRFVSTVLPSEAETTYPDLQEMMAELITAERSTITFRFEQGSSKLDSRAEGDLRRLGAQIFQGDFENKELMLIGFTDSVGEGGLNRNLSLTRAQQVVDALSEIMPAGSLASQDIVTLGYGEMSPLGCNSTLNGRGINRRVEVWVRDILASDN